MRLLGLKLCVAAKGFVKNRIVLRLSTLVDTPQQEPSHWGTLPVASEFCWIGVWIVQADLEPTWQPYHSLDLMSSCLSLFSSWDYWFVSLGLISYPLLVLNPVFPWLYHGGREVPFGNQGQISMKLSCKPSLQNAHWPHIFNSFIKKMVLKHRHRKVTA